MSRSCSVNYTDSNGEEEVIDVCLDQRNNTDVLLSIEEKEYILSPEEAVDLRDALTFIIQSKGEPR